MNNTWFSFLSILLQINSFMVIVNWNKIIWWYLFSFVDVYLKHDWKKLCTRRKWPVGRGHFLLLNPILSVCPEIRVCLILSLTCNSYICLETDHCLMTINPFHPPFSILQALGSNWNNSFPVSYSLLRENRKTVKEADVLSVNFKVCNKAQNEYNFSTR
jgi:hypothetical protein